MNKAEALRRINGAILDLQTADYASFARPLKLLHQTVRADVLKPYVSPLEDIASLDEVVSLAMSTPDNFIDPPVDPREFMSFVIQLLDDTSDDPERLLSFAFLHYGRPRKYNDALRAIVTKLIVPFGREFKDYVSNTAEGPNRESSIDDLTPNNSVFIVHGRDDAARLEAARFIERLGLNAIVLHERPNKGRTIIEKFEAEGSAGFAIVLLTPDDHGAAIGEDLQLRARQNVLLELGYFIGSIGRHRVIALKKGEIEIPSDFVGVLWEPLDARGAWKMRVAHELSDAGYNIDFSRVK